MRPFPIFAALTLLLSLPSQANAVLVSAPPKTQVPAFLEGPSESRIGLLCHNDPVNKGDPTGLTWADLMRWQRNSEPGITTYTVIATTIQSNNYFKQASVGDLKGNRPAVNGNRQHLFGAAKIGTFKGAKDASTVGRE